VKDVNKPTKERIGKMEGIILKIDGKPVIKVGKQYGTATGGRKAYIFKTRFEAKQFLKTHIINLEEVEVEKAEVTEEDNNN